MIRQPTAPACVALTTDDEHGGVDIPEDGSVLMALAADGENLRPSGQIVQRRDENSGSRSRARSHSKLGETFGACVLIAVFIAMALFGGA